MTPKRRRLYLVLVALLALGAATGLVLTAFEENLVFFHSPSDIAEKGVAPGQRIRLGGLVEQGSVQRQEGSAEVRFRITDTNRAIEVRYTGILPDLFREGQGVVTLGALAGDGSFRADEVLAKHDENYMPPEVAESLKEAGYWQEGGKGEGDKKATKQ